MCYSPNPFHMDWIPMTWILIVYRYCSQINQANWNWMSLCVFSFFSFIYQNGELNVSTIHRKLMWFTVQCNQPNELERSIINHKLSLRVTIYSRFKKDSSLVYSIEWFSLHCRHTFGKYNKYYYLLLLLMQLLEQKLSLSEPNLRFFSVSFVFVCLLRIDIFMRKRACSYFCWPIFRCRIIELQLSVDLHKFKTRIY